MSASNNGRPARDETARFAQSTSIYLMLVPVALLALTIALACGSRGCEPHALPVLLGGGDDPLLRDLIWGLRAPRALAGFAVGALLALSGALMQVLLRNPLADPYVLGVSGGGAVGAVAALWLGAGSGWVTGSAWLGASLSIALLFLLGRRGLGSMTPAAGASTPIRLLLTGVMLASGWSALIAIALSLAPEARLRGMLFWLIGDLGSFSLWWPPVLGLLLCAALAQREARSLNVMLLGDARAFSLGVPVTRMRIRICLIAALATAFAVTTAGAVGFVGLLVPHAMRRLIGNDQRHLLLAAALCGGSLVVLADTLARVLVAPTQLPVGAILSIVGVPMFLLLLSRGNLYPR